jgi:hypothetical protein
MEAFSDIFAFMAGMPAMAGMILTALIIFLTSDWRLSLTALLVQYILVGLALTRAIEAEVAVVKILAGCLAVFILYITARRIQESKGNQISEASGPRFLGLNVAWKAGPLGLPLRLLTVALILLALILLFADYQPTLVAADLAFVACWLGSMGAAGLILSGDPLRVAAALLTILAGFELIYAGLEPSLAIVGFFGAFILGVALAFAYLTTVQGLGSGAAGIDEEEAEL